MSAGTSIISSEMLSGDSLLVVRVSTETGVNSPTFGCVIGVSFASATAANYYENYIHILQYTDIPLVSTTVEAQLALDSLVTSEWVSSPLLSMFVLKSSLREFVSPPSDAALLMLDGKLEERVLLQSSSSKEMNCLATFFLLLCFGRYFSASKINREFIWRLRVYIKFNFNLNIKRRSNLIYVHTIQRSLDDWFNFVFYFRLIRRDSTVEFWSVYVDSKKD